MTGTGTFILIDGVPAPVRYGVRTLTLREPASNADRRKTDRRPPLAAELGTLRAVGGAHRFGAWRMVPADDRDGT
jgi:hypothetical protein